MSAPAATRAPGGQAADEQTTGSRKSGGGFRLGDLKTVFGGGTSGVRQFGIVFALIALLLFFQWQTGLALDSGNLINIVQQYSYILILAIGMLMVIVAGHIDLSVGSIAAFVGIVVAQVMAAGVPWGLGILIGLACGVVIGMWQGFWVAFVGVPAFIVTLAGMLLFRGLNQSVGNSQTVPVPDAFVFIGAGYLPEWGPDTGYNNSTLLLGLLGALVLVALEVRRRRTQARMGSAQQPVWASVVKVALLVAVVLYVAVKFASGRVGTSFPVSGIILLALVLLYTFLTNTTIFGRHVYAVGGNRLAAQLSGVNSRRVNFLVMTNMAVLAALAGMIFVARSNASGPNDGVGWELDAIAAVFIGGAAVSGGIGTVPASIIGGLVTAVLNNGLVLMSTGSDLVQIIKGLVLLLAVALDVYNKSQGRFSVIGAITKGFGRGGGGTKSEEPVDPRPTGGQAETAGGVDATREGEVQTGASGTRSG